MNIKQLSSGKNPEEGQINVLVEIPKDSSIKYELDKESGIILVDRFLHTAMKFPTNYGFVPNTQADDGDPLDVMVLSEYPVAPGTILPSVVIGMLEMEDEAGIDTKILAVPTEKIDPFFGAYKDINDIPEAIKNKLKHFYENYKSLEPGKWVKLKEWKNKQNALEAVKKALK
ncbi:MAG: inorganic pyrophosphatase [Patescibacteria group bacterium]|nr:MAG: inorganic pyrophosphatase [Patescibacteria group bacterium]